MEKSELDKIKHIMTEGADWLILRSLPGNMAIDSFRGFFFDWKDLAGDEFEHGTKEWDKLYKKLNSKDKKTVDAVIKDMGVNEGRLFDKDFDKINMQSSFDDKIKLIWVWIKQGKIKKWTELSDAVGALQGD